MPFWRHVPLLAALALVILAPIALRPRGEAARKVDRTLIIVTPHNEATRFEMSRAFGEFWHAKTGETLRIDWRTPGGTSEISRYVAAEYVGSFRYHWEHTLGKKWDFATEKSFDNAKLIPDATPEDDTPELAARRAFLASNVSCGIDLFFGGGAFDLNDQAVAGRLVKTGLVEAHPEIFGPGFIPQTRGGEPYWDKEGRWIGDCLSAFGICFNTDAIARLGVPPPAQWRDLAQPKFAGQIALADPTQSGSVAKAFEMILQQQMTVAVANGKAPAEGWAEGLKLIQKIAGNARYFTDSSSKIPLDVELGNAAAGMCIDFYGRFQSESVRRPDGSSRLQYLSPAGGSSVGVDPIGMFRGAPNREVAISFVEWLLSVDGQKLWNFQTGTPGGPAKFALRRLSVRPDLYAPEFRDFRSDPEVNPYEPGAEFVYHPEWTGALFRPISFIIRAMCIDPHDELKAAWRELAAAGFPPEAMAAFQANAPVDFAAANGSIKETLRSPNKIDQVRLAKELSDHFRENYRRAGELARAHR